MKRLCCIAIALLAGCGAADSTDTEKAPLPPMEQAGQPTAAKKSKGTDDTSCPLALPDARLVSEVTADGVALVFTSDGGDPTELRARVRRMVDRHNQDQKPPESRAVVEETKSGARVVFTPVDPAKVGVLREEIRVNGKEMASTGCAETTPAKSPPPAGEKAAPPPVSEPIPSPSPAEPIMPDRPVTPDHPITPPNAPQPAPPPVVGPPPAH